MICLVDGHGQREVGVCPLSGKHQLRTTKVATSSRAKRNLIDDMANETRFSPSESE